MCFAIRHHELFTLLEIFNGFYQFFTRGITVGIVGGFYIQPFDGRIGFGIMKQPHHIVQARHIGPSIARERTKRIFFLLLVKGIAHIQHQYAFGTKIGLAGRGSAADDPATITNNKIVKMNSASNDAKNILKNDLIHGYLKG